MHPRVFLVANHFLVEIKTRGACDAREHENCTNGTLGEGTHSVGDTVFAHLALGVVKKGRKTKCGGDRYAPCNKSLHTKDGASSSLLKKRKRKKKKNKRERERNKAK